MPSLPVAAEWVRIVDAKNPLASWLGTTTAGLSISSRTVNFLFSYSSCKLQNYDDECLELELIGMYTYKWFTYSHINILTSNTFVLLSHCAFSFLLPNLHWRFARNFRLQGVCWVVHAGASQWPWQRCLLIFHACRWKPFFLERGTPSRVRQRFGCVFWAPLGWTYPNSSTICEKLAGYPVFLSWILKESAVPVVHPLELNMDPKNDGIQ